MSSGGLFGRSGTKVVYQNNAQGGGLMSSLVSAATGSSHTFSPLDLKPAAWYRSDLLITLNSTTVSAWGDSSGSGDTHKNLTEGTALLQPVYTASDANFNNNPSLVFASGAGLVSTSWTSALTQPWSSFAVARCTATGSYLLDTVTGSEVAQIGNSTGFQFFAGSGSGTNTGGTVVNKTGSYICLYDSAGGGNNQYVSSNTVATQASHAAGTAGIGSLTVGNTQGLGAFAGWNIAEVAIFSGVLTAGQIASLNAYAATKYGVTIS